MKKNQLLYLKIPAIFLSCLVASLTLGNLLTITTHSIEVEIPTDTDLKWAIDPVNEELLFFTDFSIKNEGVYDIDEIDMNAKLVMGNGKQLIDFQQDDLVVKRGMNKNFEIKVNFNFKELGLLDWLELIYKNTVFKLYIDIDAHYMFSLIHLTVDEVLEFPWWAPLGNITQDGQIIKELFEILEGENTIDNLKNLTIEDLWNYENITDWGYSFKINSTDSNDAFKTIKGEIKAPIDKLNGSINFDYEIEILPDNSSSLFKIKEVNIGYASE